MATQDTNKTSGGDVELTVEKWVYGGDGLARLDGQIVLIPFVLPGETVRARIVSRQRSMLRAVPLDILAPSPERMSAACPYFGRCGGCHYQHAVYETQLKLKREILRETVRRVGKIEAPDEIEIIAGEPYGYRNRIQLHVDGARTGYREAGSHRLCPIDQCPIASPRINQALRENVAGHRFPRHVESIELFTDVTRVQAPVAENLPIEYRVGEEVYRVGRRSFFQVNRFLAGRLVERVTASAAGARALDLYAGVGLFSLPLARRFSEVVAVEAGAGDSEDLAYNAQHAGLPVRAERAAVDLYLETVADTPDLIVADPPRAGLGKQVVRELLRLQAPRIVIVSCDPATLARDLALLLAGGYRMERTTMVDLFPQTYHIETVVNLAR
ncbi:MAG: TRAM domain-containing protein [Bryobacteraceae bacterium]